ncbi:MAG TPA: RNase H family protein [Kofleriaceae bacterium]|jgi:ribonuclease HI
MPFLRHRLRDADVWAKVDATGVLITDREGRVEIVYKPVAGAKTYRAGARNLSAPSGEPIEIEVGEPAPQKPDGKAETAKAPPDAIQVWTDGGAAPNPGPSGAGVVIVDGGKHTEISQFLGEGTNQTAELSAILIGLTKLESRERPVVVYSDSAYSIGLLTQAWKAKANVELVEKLRAVCREFRDLRFVKVAGHSGVPLNERTDQLVGDAIRRRR